jgi:membrane associated rhomboid family serine protease
MRKLQVKHWQHPAIGLLGGWFAVSPWVLGPPVSNWVLAASVTLGLALVASAVTSLFEPDAGEDWVAATVGALIAVMPSLMGFADDFVASCNAHLVGIATLVLAGWLSSRDGELSDWGWDRLAR